MQPVCVVFDANVLISATVELDVTGGLPRTHRGPFATLEESSLGAVAGFVRTSDDILLFGSELLDDVVLRKLAQPSDEALRAEDRGLGFGSEEAARLYRRLACMLDDTGRTLLVEASRPARVLPGADYEDSCVWSVFCAAMAREPDRAALLVTNDRVVALQVNLEADRGRAAWAAVSAARLASVL